MIQYKIFNRLLFVLIILLLVVAVLFAYTYRLSESEIRGNLEGAAERQLEFAVGQLEKDLRQLEMLSVLLINDNNIKSYASSYDFDNINRLLQKKDIEDKLKIQSSVNKFFNQLTVYWPMNKEFISTFERKEYQADFLREAPKNKWFFTNNQEELTFHYLVTDPVVFNENNETVTMMVESSFHSDYLSTVLDGLEASGNVQSLFYFDESTYYANHSIDSALVTELEEITNLEEMEDPLIVQFGGDKYSLQFSQAPSINATLVSYIKLDSFLTPLNKVKNLAYASLAVLFVTGLIMFYLLQHDLRFNMKYLVGKIDQLGKGDYNSRVTIKANNEFDYLFHHFNQMAQKIQSLIEDVYEEKIRTREAEFKHLQAQINPHFLYNCLFYIVSMAKRSPDAVISMANNLAKYYRYITKKNSDYTSLKDEINFIESYLKVQSLRNNRIHFTIDIPDDMQEILIPTLSLQPIVENAVIHGISRKNASGQISIKGKVVENGYEMKIEDDGGGMEDKELRDLQMKLGQQVNTEEAGYGLWNIHHRLQHLYGNQAGLSFAKGRQSGLEVTIHLAKEVPELDHREDYQM